MSILFFLLFILLLASFVCLIIGLIKPTIFSRFLRGEITRKKIAKIFTITAVTSFVLCIITAEQIPKKKTDSTKTEKQVTESQPTNVAAPNVTKEKPDSVKIEKQVAKNQPTTENTSNQVTQPKLPEKPAKEIKPPEEKGVPSQLELIWKMKVSGSFADAEQDWNIKSVIAETLLPTSNGYLYCIDSKTGTERWKFKPSGEYSVMGIALNNGMVAVISTPLPSPKYSEDILQRSEEESKYWKSCSKIHAVDATTGTPKWSSQTKHGMYGGAALPNGKLLLYTPYIEGTIHTTSGLTACILNESDGTLDWESTSDWKFVVPGEGGTILLCKLNKLANSSKEINLTAMDVVSKEQRWTLPITCDRQEQLQPLWNDLSVNDNKLYFMTKGNSVLSGYRDKTCLYQVDTITRKSYVFPILWPLKESGTSDWLWVDNNVAYISTEFYSDPKKTTLTAINAEKLQQIWSLDIMDNLRILSRMVEGDTLYLAMSGGSKNLIYSLGIQDGKIKWNVQLPDNLEGPIMMANKTIYISGKNGYLYAFKIRDIE